MVCFCFSIHDGECIVRECTGGECIVGECIVGEL